MNSNRILIHLTAIAVTSTLMLTAAWAKKEERHGKEVVEAECVKCHGPGNDGAPRIGDRQAWSKRASKGIDALTRSALNGIRKMPAHGGNPGLSDFEIQCAIAHMVNLSGGTWIEPTNKTAKTANRSAKSIVKAQCFKCHETGKDGAPRIGDRDAWIPRAANGLDALVRSAINGHGGMPARGGMADLTDAEMRDTIIYMFNQSVRPAK